jgi:hypothetical protein
MKPQRPALLPVPKLVMSIVMVVTASAAAYAAEPVKPAAAKPPAATVAKAPPAESTAPKADENPETGKADSGNAGAPKDDKTSAATAAAGEEEGETAPKGPATAADKGKAPSPQRFVPSEQVRADFDVSFPIDI